MCETPRYQEVIINLAVGGLECLIFSGYWTIDRWT
jgi:hypothetical protein